MRRVSIKDLKRQSNLLSRSTVQASPRTVMDNAQLVPKPQRRSLFLPLYGVLMADCVCTAVCQGDEATPG